MRKKKTKQNHPANPCLVEIRENYNEQFHGLTKREYFAVQIMAGLCADSNFTGDGKSISKTSIEFADALIAELNK